MTNHIIKIGVSKYLHGNENALHPRAFFVSVLTLTLINMPSSCKEIRQELIECMLKSDCVLIKRNTVQECFKEEHKADVPSECLSIKRSFAECKRGMVM